MSAPAVTLHVKGYVHEGEPYADHAHVKIRFATSDDSFAAHSWWVEAQRSRLATIDRWSENEHSRAWATVYEADRIIADPCRDRWDVVPGFGAPFAVRFDGRAIGGPAFAAFVAAMPPHEVDTLGQWFAALRSSRRVRLAERWFLVPRGGGDEVDLDAVDLDKRGRALAWAHNSAQVLAARAFLAAQRAEEARAREAREAC